jgi:hypothetical protein
MRITQLIALAFVCLMLSVSTWGAEMTAQEREVLRAADEAWVAAAASKKCLQDDVLF